VREHILRIDDTFKRHDFIYRPTSGGAAVTVLTREEVDYPAVGADSADDPGVPPDLAGPLPAPDPKELAATTGSSSREYGVGDVIHDRFEVLDILGSGGFSRVFHVRDVVEDAERALKLFESAAGYDAVRREISALRRIRHPHVVEVIWADKTPHGEWYLIAEYVQGELLQAYTTGSRVLRDREAVDVALDVLDALTAIHPDTRRLDELEAKKRGGDFSMEDFQEMQELQDAGLVHRDVKPQNIILTRRGAKLLDFNIASRVGDQVKTVSGTPPYQAPDVDFTRWDVSTDLFAVGVTLYELLCNGEHPYANRKPMVGDSVRDPKQFRPDLDDRLAAFLRQACASYRDERFQTAVQMHDELQAVRAEM
jgi:serine/threonine protein kinase